jgi:hypothetical protein
MKCLSLNSGKLIKPVIVSNLTGREDFDATLVAQTYSYIYIAHTYINIDKNFAISTGELNGNGIRSNFRVANYNFRVLNHNFRVSNHDSRVSNHDSRVSNHNFRVLNHDSRISNYDSRVSNYDSRVSNYDSRVSNSNMYNSFFKKKENIIVNLKTDFV